MYFLNPFLLTQYWKSIRLIYCQNMIFKIERKKQKPAYYTVKYMTAHWPIMGASLPVMTLIGCCKREAASMSNLDTIICKIYPHLT